MRAAIRFSHTFSVVIANASGIAFPEKTACSLYPLLVRPTPRLQVASRSVLWLGSSSGFPSTTLTSPAAALPLGVPLSRPPTRSRNVMKSSRRVRRLIVDWSGNSAGRAARFQFLGSHSQLLGLPGNAAQVWPLTITEVEGWSPWCRLKPTEAAEIAADNSA